MKDQSTFTPSDFFAFRTPLLPFNELLAWSEGLEAPVALDDPARLEQALVRDRARLRDRLHTAVTRPEVLEAVFVACPDLDKFIDLWVREPETKRGQNTERALVRYFSRMAGRATPFGLFAGTSLGTIGDGTRLVIERRAKYQRHTRLDMDYLFALTDALGCDPALRDIFIYRPNSSLYRVAGRVRYVESRLDGKNRSYHLVAVEDTDYLDATLARAKRGAKRTELAQALVDAEISFAAAERFIGDLIESQILVPELDLLVTGPEPIHPLVDQLRQHVETAQAADLLDWTRTQLAEIDKAGLGIKPERYHAIAQRLENLPTKVELSRLFQVDMVKPAPEATLGGAVIAEIVKGVETLHRLAVRPQWGAFKTFREAFVARYDEREVPLVEALDEEVGIGLGNSDETSPLLKGLIFPSAQEERATEGAHLSILLRKLSEALQHGSHEIVLEPRDLEVMSRKDRPPLPDSFAVMATLAAPSQETLSQGDFSIILTGVHGPPGAAMLGRFCHADPMLRQHVEHYLRTEEALQPDAVFAEIVHLPEGRVGNVLCRPVLRGYEIPYLGRSGASPDRQIPITDLYVSVRGERIILRSASLGREVIPRLTNAHNFVWKSLGVYKFLGMLQEQGLNINLAWNWGVLSRAPFLPRIVTGRLVLSLAQWRVSKEELHALGEQRGAARFRVVQHWRDERRLPRFIGLAEADNVLPIDLNNVLSVESFVHLIKDRDEAVLIELFPAPDQLCAYGPEGAFVHDLIVPFLRRKDEG